MARPHAAIVQTLHILNSLAELLSPNLCLHRRFYSFKRIINRIQFAMSVHLTDDFTFCDINHVEIRLTIAIAASIRAAFIYQRKQQSAFVLQLCDVRDYQRGITSVNLFVVVATYQIPSVNVVLAELACLHAQECISFIDKNKCLGLYEV
jgi:hypothetical protein